MIWVAQPVEIESTHGAAFTVLVGAAPGALAVSIFSSHVQFGKEKKGFTIVRGSDMVWAGDGLG